MLLGAALMGSALWACHSSNHGHEEVEEHAHHIAYQAYNPQYEVFFEGEPFIVNQENSFLLHLTRLADFKAADSLNVAVSLGTDSAIYAVRVHPGIYKVTLTPSQAGAATLNVALGTGEARSAITVPLEVYSGHDDAHEAAEAAAERPANTVSFSKEMSWNCNFATDSVTRGSFATVISSTALVESAGADVSTVAARTAGTVVMRTNTLVPGKVVYAGEHLLTIDAASQSDNNLAVTIAQARAEYNAARRDYERKSILAQEQIVSQADLLEAQRRFEDAQSRYRQLEHSFPGGIQNVTAPSAGTIADVYVANGQFVETGTPLFAISQGRSLTLTAKVPATERPALANIAGAVVRVPATGRTFTLDELNGELIGYGRTAADGSAQVPVTFAVGANPALVPGTFVDIYINVGNYSNEVSVPKDAVIEEMGNNFVFVQVNPELFEKRLVAVGRTDGRNCVITSGLTGGERIITRGAVLVKLAQSSGTLDAHAGHVH